MGNIVRARSVAFLVAPFVCLLAVCFSYSPSVSAVQTIPYKMNFQGRLTDSSGTPKADGTYNMKFRIYDASTGGTLVWSEERSMFGSSGVSLVNGLFSTQLGDVSALDPADFTDPDLYFEIELPTPATATCATSGCAVYTEGAMTPRNKLGSSAYAFNADTIDGIDGTNLGQLNGSNIWTGTNQIKLNSATAFNVQNASSQDAFNIDTSTSKITLGVDTTIAADKYLKITGSGSRPGSPTEGMIYYDTTTKQLLTYANGKWQSDSKAATFIVAASNSTQAAKDGAQYVADGEDSAGAGIGTLDGDQIQINAALTAAGAAKGGTVYLAPGTYTIDATISIPNNVTLAGAGASTLIQLGNFGATSVDINMISNTDTTTGTRVGVRDLRLDGRDTTNTVGSQRGIYFSNMGGGSGTTARDGAKLSSLYVRDMLTTAILFSASSNNIVTNITSLGSANGIALSGSASNNTVTGNLFQGNSNSGIYISTSYNNMISGNTVEGNGTYGVYVISSNLNNISSNKINDNGGATANSGIYLDSSDSNSVTNNDITDTSCSSTCYSINISNSTSDYTYLSDNRHSATGTPTINDAGTGTIFANQAKVANGGQITIQSANSTASFQVQNASAVSLFTVDSTNGRLYVGPTAGDTVGTLLVLGNKTNAGDPTGVEGVMYYNSDTKSLRCFNNGLWRDCDFASLRSEWVLQEDFIAGVSSTFEDMFESGWEGWWIGTTGTISKVDVGADSSDRDRVGVLSLATASSSNSGMSLELDYAKSMTGVPSNMTMEFDFAPSSANAAAGLNQTLYIGLHDANPATTAAPTDGMYFRYSTTTSAGNWYRCTQATCVDTGVAFTTTLNQYQRFKIQTNSAGTQVDFYINEVSVGGVTTNLPGATASYGPQIKVFTSNSTNKAWKIDYFQIKRNLTTLR